MHIYIVHNRKGEDGPPKMTSFRNEQPRQFSALDPFTRHPSCPNMPWYKKSKKRRQPAQNPISFIIPTNIVVGPLGISAGLVPVDGAFRSVELNLG